MGYCPFCGQPYPDTEPLWSPPGPLSQVTWVEGGVGVSQEGRLQHVPTGPIVLEAALIHVHLCSRCLEVQGHYRQDRAVTGCGLASAALEPSLLRAHEDFGSHGEAEAGSRTSPMPTAVLTDPPRQPHVPFLVPEFKGLVGCLWGFRRCLAGRRLFPNRDHPLPSPQIPASGPAWVPTGSCSLAGLLPAPAAPTDLAAPIPHLHGAVVGGVRSPPRRVDPAQVTHIVADKAVSWGRAGGGWSEVEVCPGPSHQLHWWQWGVLALPRLMEPGQTPASPMVREQTAPSGAGPALT